VNRAIRILLILAIGGLVLWETLSWGSRTWVKYKLLKEPLPSITTLLPTSMIQPIITMLLITTIAIVVINGIIRSRKIFGIIPMSELVRHMVVLGPTGSGKTTVAKTVLEKAVKEGKSAVIIDWKGEYVQFLPGAAIIRKIDNIWNVPGESAREKALVAVELIREMSKDTVEISPPSSLLLLRVLTEEYERGVPTTEKIVKVLERHAEIAQREGRYAESNMYLALVRRLFILLVDEERKAENEIAEGSKVTIYDLGGLPSIYLKTLYAAYVLASLYREAMKAGMGEGLKTLLIAEEAQNYIFARRPGELPSMAERTVYELRSYGVGVILVCPDPELLPMAVLKDVGAVVSMGPDSLPRFALERYLFRASLEEAEKTLKELKKAKLVIYHRGNLHYLRRLPKPPKILKPKERPKGGRMGVTKSGVGSLRAWPILPHRSPGRPKVVEVKEEAKKPEVIEVKEEPIVEKLRLEPEELEEVEEPVAIEVEVEKSSEPMAEPIEKEAVEEAVEVKEEIEEKVTEEEESAAEESAVEVEEIEEELTEEMPLEESKPEPAPKGPPIPSTLP
jgi:energy-coupling factor transporter ATP-binding protein EcfA2